MSSMAAAIKERVSAREAACFYGFVPDRAGFIPCPFHTGDDHGSLKLYDGDRGFHCFACGAGSTVIDFTMLLFGISFREACLRLNVDFKLGLSDQSPSRAEISAAVAARRQAEAEKAQRKAEILALCHEHCYWWECLKYFPPPQLLEDGNVWWHPLCAEALQRLPILNYQLSEYGL